ncbi:hypothetical protein [Nannocystis punicea]|uniref:Uncharacterized protein n=1 Tax=Nannocystis punicea TaxID=2995304 RepID=A0ABY7GXU5_9BACT|nr:hypothetical protein [Nannocystis poenicansa]WAS91799.1 hypothetical protein O0S08_36920 [Nannocystis poenicansa]
MALLGLAALDARSVRDAARSFRAGVVVLLAGPGLGVLLARVAGVGARAGAPAAIVVADAGVAAVAAIEGIVLHVDAGVVARRLAGGAALERVELRRAGDEPQVADRLHGDAGELARGLQVLVEIDPPAVMVAVAVSSGLSSSPQAGSERMPRPATTSAAA